MSEIEHRRSEKEERSKRCGVRGKLEGKSTIGIGEGRGKRGARLSSITINITNKQWIRNISPKNRSLQNLKEVT